MEKESLILCDTNILIEFYKGKQDIIKVLASISQENIAVSIVTVGELLHGALNKHELKKISQDLSHLNIVHISEKTGQCFYDLMKTYSLSIVLVCQMV